MGKIRLITPHDPQSVPVAVSRLARLALTRSAHPRPPGQADTDRGTAAVVCVCVDVSRAVRFGSR